ncbi:hypothetical protein F5Y15DRAFT_383722 [Xylariaceae sp. FL0016]|nr:hypothetical protein F5Y15DRAFT_383722 [Xylariaceae sp. FL0016]
MLRPMSKPRQVNISCHCASAAQTVALGPSSGSGITTSDLCHCETCRRTSGLLCASYAVIGRPEVEGKGMVAYRTGPAWDWNNRAKDGGRGGGKGKENIADDDACQRTGSCERFFCGRCGAHIFRRDGYANSEHEIWGVATGVIIGDANEADRAETDGNTVLKITRHVNTARTKDGGLSRFIVSIAGDRLDVVASSDWSSTGEGVLGGRETPGSPWLGPKVLSQPPTPIPPLPPPDDIPEIPIASVHRKALLASAARESAPEAILDHALGDEKHTSKAWEGGARGCVACETGPSTGDAETAAMLKGRCHCGDIRFHITHPDAASVLPKSNFPDLMVPYHDPANAELLTNPNGEKWWLCPEPRDGGTDETRGKEREDEGRSMARYRAGFCACPSCRLTSGFEIQPWSFVPRSNIRMHVHDPDHHRPSVALTEGFEPLRGVLRSYASSPGVVREFCGRCGATVFWHDEERGDLFDVSVGLLSGVRKEQGSRDEIMCEEHLEWWRDRVSFVEEADVGRTGSVGVMARDFMKSLEAGLKGEKL